ncbi:MAG: VOC family protein [Pseudomonadota bacterium]
MADMHGTICWNELNTRDVPKAKAYYSKVLGWEFDDVPMEGGAVYHLAKRNGAEVAGVFNMTGMPGMDEVPEHWFTYLAVADVDAAVAQTEEMGGTVQRAPFDAEGVGRIAIVRDATGAAVGLMTPVG